MTKTINLSVSKGLRSLKILAPAALLFGATGCIAPADAADEADDQVDRDEPLSAQQDAALKAGVALKEVTYRITDDVSTKLVTADRPGRTMDAAGNSTMSWVYGQANVAGVCDDLYDKNYAVSTLQTNVAKLRELSPLWEMFKDGIDISSIQWAAH